MARGKRFSPEQIVVVLRQIEVQLAQGKSIALACKKAAIAEQNSGTSVSCWRPCPASRKRRWWSAPEGITTTACGTTHGWARACHRLIQSSVAARQRTPVKDVAVFS